MLFSFNSFVPAVYTNHDLEQDNDGAPPTATKLPLTILKVTSQCPLEGGAIVGDICESAFHENDNLSVPDKSFRSFAATAGCYEFEVQQREFQDNYLLTKGDVTNEFVGVSSLDILQGVGQGKIYSKFFMENYLTLFPLLQTA